MAVMDEQRGGENISEELRERRVEIIGLERRSKVDSSEDLRRRAESEER